MTTIEKQKSAAFEVPINIQVSAQLLADIIITAIEGGFGTWFPKQRLRSNEPPFNNGDWWDPAIDKGPAESLDTVVVKFGDDENDDIPHSFMARNVAAGGTMTYYEDDPEGSEEKDWIPHTLNRHGLLKGLAHSMKNPNFSRYLGSPDDDGNYDIDIDAIHADYIIQYALLGEVKYG